MSCYIVRGEIVAAVADAMRKHLEKCAKYSGTRGDAERAFKACETAPGVYDTHKIYRRLYIENLRAYNGRYGETVREFAKYSPHTQPDIEKLYSHICCFHYQICEDATAYGDVIKAVEELRDSIANDIAGRVIRARFNGWAS